ncbi:hypothetical protein [Acetobacterium malicum]|uniref:hypothetical protein n=1 Tax=Acetobacterium malicum TaxID=52692 RepID=UPI00041457BC|nr:hypothetical protein [Acetobacterium dehalogenans]
MKKPKEIQKSCVTIANIINESSKKDDKFDLLDFMQRSVSDAGVKEIKNVSRSFLLNGKKENGKIKFVYDKDNSGIVYGFAMRLNDTELEMLFNEAKKLKTVRFSKIEEIEEVSKGIYLLYWGLSDLLIGRLIAHINGHKNNSNLHLCNYSFFNAKELFYATIAVTDKAVFETYLIDKYPPMLKTMGRKKVRKKI